MVGLYPDQEAAEGGAGRLAEQGIAADVRPGAPVSEGRMGRHLLYGFLTGMLVALPFAIVLPFLGWAYHHVGASPLDAVGWLFLPILFVGGFLGLMTAGARFDMARRNRSRAVVTEAGLDAQTERRATATVDRTGGDVVDKPKLAD